MRKQKGITLISLIITIIIMMILVGVTVTVAIKGDLFDKTKQAALGMSMAQIQEKAEMAKYTVLIDVESSNNNFPVVETYKERLKEEFGEENITISGNNIMVYDKYYIVIKNSDLEIEVIEELDIMNIPIILETATTNEEDKVILTLKFKVALTEEEFAEKIENATVKQKQKAVEDYLYKESGAMINTIDEYVLYALDDASGKGYSTIGEYLKDKDILDFFGETDEELDIGKIYYYIATEGSKDGTMTREEFISTSFEQIYGEPEQIYEKLTEYFIVKIDDTTYGVEDVVPYQEITLTHNLYKSGAHEITIINPNEENVVTEKINIKTNNKYVLTEEQASGIWETDGKGTITKYLGKDSLVEIPTCIGNETIYRIGRYSMNDLTFIEEITIPNSITTIETHAFARCTSLNKITIPNSVKNIDSYVFYGCTSLEEIALPDSITIISDSLFENCILLSKVMIPNSVTTIEKFAFSHCESLKRITLPDTITSMGGVVFSCSGLEEITIPDSVKTMGNNVFESCGSLKKVKLPNSITSIGDHMFAYCTALKEITIPNSVGSISERAFQGCDGITITFEKGENTVPTGFPWYAANATLIDKNS